MKRRKHFFLLSCVILLFAGIVAIPAKTFAQEGVGLRLSPVTFELTANPGDTLVNKVRIWNPTTTIISVKMEAEDFVPMGETGEVLIVEPDETKTFSLARWVTTSPDEFTLAPGEDKFVDFYIDVPQNAEPGSHYGSVLATTRAVLGEGITGVGTAQKVGTLVLLIVSGKMEESLKVKEFSAPSFSEYGPVEFLIRFENQGTVHVRPRGFVTITNWRGKKAVDIEFPQMNVIPGAIRKITARWDKKVLIGRYTATLIGSYGASNNPLEPAIITFWVFPWKVGAGITAGVLLALFFFIKTRRRWFLALRILLKGEKE
ncbi:MAG: hypothetical protein COT34_00200 [Candidatus Nealsonbacteria bacterium CG08_land_8_20_14_0_20_43_11]|uniref:DUF916 domain-containing protein n=1 Tax=Candidatus Nealsonbacteria bacterium CG08_land_8_20_14_0_20_43_11 TaxID=1974706 RepID=A0A2M6T1A3_9BACT|nr:MAG: hypothetical protein COT34_00200 [Candidatus Nealsonbacteria bacterium CG08_land_8_20_14_0_20_43_11]